MTETSPSAPLHVCLVSRQLLPNLIPALMEKPARVHLVVSTDMSAESTRFKKQLSNRGIAFTVHDRAPSTGLPQLLDYATELACALEDANPERPIVLNATGGTKLMALAFVEIFRELRNAAIIYTDTEHGRIESLSDRARPTRPMASVLDIETYLAAYAFILRRSASDDETWRERAEARKALSKWLARQAGGIGDFLGALNWLVHGEDGALDAGEILVRPTQAFRSGPPRNRWREAMEEISRFGLVDWDGGAEITFRDADTARYLGGLWLEEYAWHVLRDEHPDEVKVGVQGTWEGDRKTPSRNEFDLLAVHGNRMLVVECKTARFGRDDQKDADILYKLDSLARSAGGLFGRALLLSARPLPPDARIRAKTQRIEIIEGNRLGELRTFVRDWMQGSGRDSNEQR